MSLIGYAMKFIGSASSSSVTCPICGLRAAQPVSKIRRKQAMLCQGCKALFIPER